MNNKQFAASAPTSAFARSRRQVKKQTTSRGHALKSVLHSTLHVAELPASTNNEVELRSTTNAKRQVFENEFADVCFALNLSEDEWLGSTALRRWVGQYAQKRYVPEWLLAAWGIRVRFDLWGL